MMFKIASGLVAVPPIRLLQPTRSLRGHNRKFKTISTTCDTVKFSFYPRTIPTWNSLSNDIVESENIKAFKSKYLT